jgi:hypothetical protein
MTENALVFLRITATSSLRNLCDGRLSKYLVFRMKVLVAEEGFEPPTYGL